MFYMCINFDSIFFPLVLSPNFTIVQYTFSLNLVLFKTVCKGRCLGWVVASEISIPWILKTFSLCFPMSRLFVIMPQSLIISFGRNPSLVRLNTLRNVLNLKNLVFHPSHCKVCYLAKQKWLPFLVSNTITHSPFELMHLDI